MNELALPKIKRSKTGFTDFVQNAFGQPNLTLTLTAFLLGLLGNTLANLLGSWSLWGISGNWIIVFVITLLVVVLWYVQRRRTHRGEVEISVCAPEGKAGLIILLSTLNPFSTGTKEEATQRRQAVQAAATWIAQAEPGNLRAADFEALLNTNLEPALRALEWHLAKAKLEHCWTIGSPDEPAAGNQAGASGSAWLGEILKRWYECLHPATGVTFHATQEVPARNYGQLWAAVDRVFGAASLKPEHIICDITGGLKLMSIGAALACLEEGRTMQYMDSARDWKGDPVPKGQMEPVLIDITPYLVS